MRAKISSVSDDITITTDPALIDVDAALALLHETDWARDMSRDTLARAMRHSLCFGVLRAGTLVGLARVVTDRATFGYLTDVVIAATARGEGLGHRLVDEIVRHPDLQGLRRLALLTSDAMKLYADFGFVVGPRDVTYMERR